MCHVVTKITATNTIRVQEFIDGRDNIQIEAIATDTEDIARITDKLTEIGIDVVASKILKSDHIQPFDYFGQGLENS